MERIQIIGKGNTKVLIVDYSDAKEEEMITLVTSVKAKVISNGEPICILSIYNDRSYATVKFMRQVEIETASALHLVKKQAVVGLNDTKKMILKGYNFLFRKNIPAFGTRGEAMEFLLDDSKSDASDFWDNPAIKY